MAAQHDALYTYDDLLDFPVDGRRRELVDGVLHVSPLARRNHQWVVGQIHHRIRGWVEERGHGAVYPGVKVDLGARTHLEPDVAWSVDGDRSGEGFTRVPEFVVEVLSPGTVAFDRGDKLERYARDGAREVWLVDLEAEQIEQYVVRDGLPGEPTVHRPSATFASPLFPGLDFAVDDLLGRQ